MIILFWKSTVTVASNDWAFQSVYQQIQCLLMFSNNG